MLSSGWGRRHFRCSHGTARPWPIASPWLGTRSRRAVACA